jgi:hypothetical protein
LIGRGRERKKGETRKRESPWEERKEERERERERENIGEQIKSSFSLASFSIFFIQPFSEVF